MILPPEIHLLYSLSGFGVGFLVGMTGVGGGALMTPLLILLFGVHPATAVGTDLLYAAATKAGGTLVHSFHRTIDWRVVGRLAAGSVPMTALTLFLLARLKVDPEAARAVVTTVLSGALFVTAVALILRRKVVKFFAERFGEFDPKRQALFTILTGAILGVLVSLSSVGAGAIGVTALVVLYPKLPTVAIVGSDIAHAVPLTLVAGIGHWLIGSIDGPLLASLLLGSLPGIFIGSYASGLVPDAVLRPILAVTLIVVGSKLIF
ncbi:MAG TPA: sulfite exporter TauE/SafE family protein [Stellaceae bacterium]|nr:sulfite exporter TauE/SafE family protein [Stellaceae bacterium]